MMEQDRRLQVVIIVIGVLAILLSTCLGAFAGSIAGYWAGRKAASTWISTRPVPEQETLPVEPEEPWPFPLRRGALVTEVAEDSPADQAGIRPGDVIIAVNDKRIDEEGALQRIVRSYQPGDRVEITLWRSGRELTVSVRLAKHPKDETVAYLGVFYRMQPMSIEPPKTD